MVRVLWQGMCGEGTRVRCGAGPRVRLSPHDEPTFPALMTREGRETQKKNSRRSETRLLGLLPVPRLVDVMGAGKPARHVDSA